MTCFELLRRRRQAGLTQTDLAKRAGVHISTIVRLERGRVRTQFDAHTLERVASALGASVSEVFSDIEHPAVSQPDNPAA